MKILLIEPDYKCKYPPLGLMKIATYHRIKGDEVVFFKGRSLDLRAQKWDRIYISTLFTYYWNETMRTIHYYKNSVCAITDIFVGGIMATLMGDEISKEIPVTLIRGLLNESGVLGNDNIIVDTLVPDYSILTQITFRYPTDNAYITYTTRGCKNKCKFCAVSKLEPDFKHHSDFKHQVLGIKKIYGEKKDLLLLDNNVLASSEFERILEEIKDLGFVKGAKLNNRLRFVDFNQGLDARLLTEKKVELLSELPLRPMRIAFDNIKMKDLYVEKIKLAAKYGIVHLSNYILYNYNDSPLDLYRRLKINVLLNEELGTKIYSFPMKFIPLNAKDRSYVSPKWTKKYIRAIQSILLATHGMVSPGKTFFEAAFGKNEREFSKIMLMPEAYIINREKHKLNGGVEWSGLLNKMNTLEKSKLKLLIRNNKVADDDLLKVKNRKIRMAAQHYLVND